MSRRNLGVLLVVLLALAGAYLYSRNEDPRTTPSNGLDALVAEAALDPCPTSLGGNAGLPDLRLPCLTGGPSVPLRGPASGTPSLVNVYGSWCAPCLAEMPLLRRFHELAGQRVAVVGVDTEDPPRDALQFAKDVGQHWPVLVDDDGLVSRHLGGGAPKTVFLDARGTVVYVHRNAFDSLAQLRALCARYLGVTV